MRLTLWQYLLVFFSLVVLGTTYVSLVGVKTAPDVATYSRWADILIQNHFSYPLFLSSISFEIPPIFYIGWITVVAILKLVLASQWGLGLVVVNVALFAVVGTVLVYVVGLLSDTKFPPFLAWLIYGGSFDLWQWTAYTLSDISALVLTFSPFLVYTLYLKGYCNRVVCFVGLLGILVLAIFYRPSSIPLLATFAVCAVVTFQTVTATLETRARYARFLLLFVVVGIISILFLGSLLAQNPNLWPFSFGRAGIDYVSWKYSMGMVVYDRLETFHQSPVVLMDYLSITFDKFISYFSPTAEGFSFLHKVIALLYYIPVYCLAGWGLLGLFCSEGYSRTGTWLVATASVLFILSFASYHAVTILDFDWRYRVPCIPVLILLASLGLDLIQQSVSSFKKGIS